MSNKDVITKDCNSIFGDWLDDKEIKGSGEFTNNVK